MSELVGSGKVMMMGFLGHLVLIGVEGEVHVESGAHKTG